MPLARRRIQRDGSKGVMSNQTESGRAGHAVSMKPQSLSLSIISTAAAAAVAVWLAVGHQARLRLGEENKVLRQ